MDYALFSMLTSQDPLCFLSDCTLSPYSLNRLNTSARKEFEKELLDVVKQKYPSKESKLVYVSFASGFLFSDCVILTKLIQEGYTNIDVHCIDTLWAEYIAVTKTHGTQVAANILDENPKRQHWLRIHTYRFMQFIQWLTWCAKKDFKVSIYGSADSYIDALKNNPALQSDILISIDHYQLGAYKTEHDFKKLVLSAAKVGSLIGSLEDNLNGAYSKFIKEKALPIPFEQIEDTLNKLKKQSMKQFFESL